MVKSDFGLVPPSGIFMTILYCYWCTLVNTWMNQTFCIFFAPMKLKAKMQSYTNRKVLFASCNWRCCRSLFCRSLRKHDGKVDMDTCSAITNFVSRWTKEQTISIIFCFFLNVPLSLNRKKTVRCRWHINWNVTILKRSLDLNVLEPFKASPNPNKSMWKSEIVEPRPILWKVDFINLCGTADAESQIAMQLNYVSPSFRGPYPFLSRVISTKTLRFSTKSEIWPYNKHLTPDHNKSASAVSHCKSKTADSLSPTVLKYPKLGLLKNSL